VIDEPVAQTTDPDGQKVVFDDRARGHLASRRPALLGQLDVILGAVSLPDHREDDPIAGHARFYRQNAIDPGRWLRVVVDFDELPGRIVTVLVQENDPRNER
jgi:hypothetical protein